MYIIPHLKGAEIFKYLRKSRSDDPLLTVEEVLANHDQIIDDWMAQALPDCGPIPEENTFREVVSGETIDSRPEMKRLLRLIESPKAKAIVCKEPSRLSRGDLQDIGYLVKILRYTNTLVLTPRGCYDLRDDRDRDQFERELMRGNDYLEYQKKIMFDGKLLALKNGNYIGAYAPYGYKKISYKEGRKTCKTLEPDPDEAPVVKRIFEMYRDGLGAVRICDVLDAEHVKPRNADHWSPNTIDIIITNPQYLGKVRWNFRPYERRVVNGEVVKHRFTADECLIFEGKHPAIISQELWDEVQAVRGKKPRRKKSTKGLQNPLARVLRCSCGAVMTYKQTTRKGKPLGDPRFLCGDSRCHRHGTAKVSEVVDEVVKVLEECIDDFELQIKAGTDDSVERHKQLVDRLEKKLAELKALETKQWDEKIKGKIPDHVFDTLNGQTVAEIAEVTQALCEAKDATPQPVDLEAKAATFHAAVEALKDPDAPVEEQNKLVQACIETITYSRPRLQKGRCVANNPPFKLEFTLRV